MPGGATYLRERAAEHELLATKALDPPVRRAHAALAAQYRAYAGEVERGVSVAAMNDDAGSGDRVQTSVTVAGRRSAGCGRARVARPARR